MRVSFGECMHGSHNQIIEKMGSVTIGWQISKLELKFNPRG